MKGLLIKDGRLMITQGKTLLGIAVFMIVCSFLQGDSFPQFAASYSIMMTTILQSARSVMMSMTMESNTFWCCR